MTRRKTATTAGLPSEVTNVRNWRTREDPSSTVWEHVRQQIGRFGPSSGESSRVAALAAKCSRYLLFMPSELISY